MTDPQFERKRQSFEQVISEAESTLKTGQEREDFVTLTFLSLRGQYDRKQIDHTTYITLINQLATFHQGAYNDYLDMLVGAAILGALDIMLAHPWKGNLAEEARKRSKAVTDLTGLPPVPPDEK